MTDLSSKVLQSYQVRKTKKQRGAFRALIGERARELGYSVREERGSLGATNLILGEPERAKLVFTAHYDTCARLPFPNLITPKSMLLYILWQLVIVFGFMLLPLFILEFGIGMLLGALGADYLTVELTGSMFRLIYLFGFLFMMIAGPANKHTANDNTSGVITLIEIMESLPEGKRDGVIFVFFDLEEAGLIGSSAFVKAHPEVKRVPLINFDCVSDGDHILFALTKGARSLADALAECYVGDGKKTVDVAKRGTVYPSDQMLFTKGVGVAALKRSKLGILYMDRIHTSRDTVFDEENIRLLKEGSGRLVMKLCGSENKA